MPHRKKYRRSNGKSAGVKALKLARSLKSSQERKFFDTIINVNANFTGSASIPLNNPAQGLTDSQRIGDTIKCLSMRWRYKVSQDNSVATAIRAIYIWDKRNTIQT